MESQHEFKEEMFIVSMQSIVPVYRLANGMIFLRNQYDDQIWNTQYCGYEKEDYALDIAVNHFQIEKQEKLVNTLSEAIKFQVTQTRRLITIKQGEIEQLHVILNDLLSYDGRI